MATSSFQPQLASFNGKDYNMWAIKMETMLKAHDVWDHVKYGLHNLKMMQKNEPSVMQRGNSGRKISERMCKH